jgi:hypothetical protein
MLVLHGESAGLFPQDWAGDFDPAREFGEA